MKNVEMTIYANYGLLAHEKQTVYTLAQATNICDTVRVIIPNVSGANVVDEPILNLDGQDYLLSEVLPPSTTSQLCAGLQTAVTTRGC